MPFVVLPLLPAEHAARHPLRRDRLRGTRFGWFLPIKVTLAFTVLGVFVNAAWAGLCGRMSVCRFRRTLRAVLVLMMGIVFLAKTMFYL